MDYMQAWTPSLIENHINRREAQNAKISNNWKQNCCWNFDKLVLSLSLDESANLNLNLNSEKISLCIFPSVYILHFHFASHPAEIICSVVLAVHAAAGNQDVLRFLTGSESHWELRRVECWDFLEGEPECHPATLRHSNTEGVQQQKSCQDFLQNLTESFPAALLRNVFRHWGQKKEMT